MRVAFLFGGAHANYLEDLTACGLAALVGSENVVAWLQKDHLQSKRPEKTPERCCWNPVRPVVREIAPVDIKARVYDLIVLGTPSSAEFAGAQEDIVRVACEAHVLVVLLDGEDTPVSDKMLSVLPEGPWLVREAHRCADSRVVHFPLCYNALDLPAPVPWTQRDISVLWVGASHCGREPYIDALRSAGAAKIITSPISHAEYLDLLGRSKVCACLPGAGDETYRHLEAAAAGALPTVKGSVGCVDQDAALLFDTPESLGYNVATMLKNDAELRMRAEACRRTLLRKHLHPARAAQLLALVGA